MGWAVSREVPVISSNLIQILTFTQVDQAFPLYANPVGKSAQNTVGVIVNTKMTGQFGVAPPVDRSSLQVLPVISGMPCNLSYAIQLLCLQLIGMIKACRGDRLK